MNETEAVTLFKCLADRSRLQILKSLAKEDMYVERLAERLNLTAATVSFHLKKLSEAGAVTSSKTQYYTVYSLNKAIFDTSILQVIMDKSEDADAQEQRDQAYRQRVLDAFFEYGKLVSIPVQRKKERIVLEKIIEAFQFNKIYSERQVNMILADYNDDFCTLRRDLVCEKLLERDPKGFAYWRSKPEK